MNDEVWTHGYNSCLHVAISALNHLSSHPRPAGGQEAYNAEHLLQIADEIKRTIAHNVKIVGGLPAQRAPTISEGDVIIVAGRLRGMGALLNLCAALGLQATPLAYLDAAAAKAALTSTEQRRPEDKFDRIAAQQNFYDPREADDYAVKLRSAALSSTDGGVK